MPLSLSDSELDVIINLARPLEPEMRDAFLRAIATELARYQHEALGPGLVSRIAGSFRGNFGKRRRSTQCRDRGRGEGRLVLTLSEKRLCRQWREM